MSSTALNPLVDKIRNAHPGVYDDMDDATLTKKVLAKYPQYSDLAVPDPKSAPKPAVPKELAPPSFSERVGERIRQTASMIPNAIEGHTASYQSGLTTPKAKAEAQKELDEATAGRRHMTGADAEPILGSKTLGKAVGAVTIGPRIVIDQAKQYAHDPAALVGDVVLLFPELAEMRAPGNKTFKPGESPAPKATTPDPAYTKALDKANEGFSADAKVYNDKITKSFDEAKREHTENVAKYEQEAKTHAEKSSEARAKWIKEWSDYRKAEVESRDAAQRAQTLAKGVKDTVKSVYDNLKQTYETGRKALNGRWSVWNKDVAGISRDPKGVFDAIEEAKAKQLRGAPGSLPEFNNLLHELGVQEFETAPDGTKQAVPGQSPIPIETLRAHYSAVARRIIKGGLPGNMYHALEDVRAALDKQIVDGIKDRMANQHPLYTASGGAPIRDLVSEYEALKADEGQFLTDWEGKIKVGKHRVKSPLSMAFEQLDPNYLEPKILGVGNEYIAKQLEKYKQYGADSTLLSKATQLESEAKAAAKVKVKTPKEPSAEPPKEGVAPAKPELPHKAVPESPELKSVERPEAAARKLGMMSKAAAKIVGKLGGALAGSVVGHPMVGWAAGGELAPEILSRIMEAKGKSAAGAVTPAEMNALPTVEKTGIQNGIARRLVEAAEKGEPLPPLEKFRSVLTDEQMRQVMQAAMKGGTGSVQ